MVRLGARLFFALLGLGLALGLAPARPDAPAKPGEWVELLKRDAFVKVDPKWILTDSVALDSAKANRLKAGKAVENGSVWVNGTTGRVADLITRESFEDLELHAEFIIAKGSNSGIKFHGLYEIQILDTFGKTVTTGNSLGGLYPRAETKAPHIYLDKGVPPAINSAKKPGEWQTLTAIWRSPRFDGAGKMTTPGKIETASLNGQVIHTNTPVSTPTGGNWVRPNTPKGPILLQGDHGPVAFRNVRVKPLPSE